MADTVVIAGSGLAGYHLARELRKLDTQIPLVIVSRDDAAFYSKPMLSNALASKKTVATLVMKSAKQMAAELSAQIITGKALQAINGDACSVTLDDGEVLPYRNLVLALGADAIQLPLAGNAADAVISVNDLDGFARFTQALDGTTHDMPAKRVAILGAGLIGCEFANDLLARDITPVVIDLAHSILPRLLPAPASARLQAKLNTAGAEFHFGVSALAVNHCADGLLVSLSDGTFVGADVVLSAVGLQPRTSLASQAGLAVNRGVVVDKQLTTSMQHVYALGDCAEVGGWVLPYVMPLMTQARALAATLTGNPTTVSYPALPVVVKTPAWPTVVCPPSVGAKGEWSITQTEASLEARFMSKEAPLHMLGFVLQGKAVSQRQAWALQVPAWMP